jgi:proline iminopeptidase
MVRVVVPERIRAVAPRVGVAHDRRPAGEQHAAGAAGTPGAPAVREAMLGVPGGRIWYRVLSGGAGTPVILLHGGPGFSSIYMKSLEALATDRPLVRYDQLGSGRSDGLTDTAAFAIPHFVAELDSLRASLGYPRVHLLGHSWGTILAVEYYRVHPEHVASMVLGSAALDIPAWERHARALVVTLSDSSQRAIRRAEAAHAYDAADYQAALGEFYDKYVWRHPVKADLDSLFATANQAMYNYMQGPSEFTITGTLKTYDVTSFLSTIRVPVLYTVGEFDEADPVTIRRFASLTPGAQLAVLPGSAHITMWDAPAENVREVRAFLRGADSAHARHLSERTDP